VERNGNRATDPLVTVAPEEIRAELAVNFGLASGRTATAAEIQELGTALLELLSAVEVSSEDVYEFGQESVATVHRIRIHCPGHALAEAADVARAWLAECVEQRAIPPLDS
jgi:hypothetical protein